MIFNVNIPVLAIVLFGIAVLALAYICAVYCRRLYLIRRTKRQCNERFVDVLLSQSDKVDDMTQKPNTTPKVSIVIFTRNEPEALLRNLPKMLDQKYAPGFEVIVVNEGSDPDTNYAVGMIRMAHPNLYLTFTPDGARSLSRKKLALTIGVKAAKGEIVIISDATVRIDSDRWIESMVQPFENPDTQVVLGCGAPLYPTERNLGRQMRIFDLTADNATWISAAIAGHPYRGCGYNLAYRRQVFFDNKGFSRSLNLRDGDDDIFVNEITNGDNTAVQLADYAVARRETHAFKRQARDYRMGHAFTGRRVPMTARRLMVAGEWMMWVIIACGIAGACVCGVTNMFGWAVAATLIIGMLVTVAISWHRTCRTLLAPVTPIWTWLLALTRPIRNMRVTLRSRMAKSGQYTWQ